MNFRNLVLIAGLSLSPFALAAEVNLVTPTGAVVACDAIGQVKQSDMPRLFGIYNTDAAHTQFVRFRTFGPRDCRGAETGKLAARETLSGARAVLADNAAAEVARQ